MQNITSSKDMSNDASLVIASTRAYGMQRPAHGLEGTGGGVYAACLVQPRR